MKTMPSFVVSEILRPKKALFDFVNVSFSTFAPYTYRMCLDDIQLGLER